MLERVRRSRRLAAVIALAMLAAACGTDTSDTTAGPDELAEPTPNRDESSGTTASTGTDTLSSDDTNEAAFATFLAALGTGDRELAATVATPEALGVDEWLGYDGLPNPAKPGHLTNAEGTLTGTTADYWLAPGRTIVCELDGGIVVTCTSGE